ncbi:MAG: glutathione S-transferase [Myxococcota bacterium]|jgi:glutathione S-transferase
MSPHIYWGSGSPFAWRAMLALAVKGIDYTDTLLQFSEKEHKAPDYLALNPRGKVPTLTDGDFALYESGAIMRYLDAKYPDPPLWGTTPEEAGLVERELQEFHNYSAETAFKLILPIWMGKAAKKIETLQASAEKLHPELSRMNKALDGRDWLASATVSAADISAYPHLQLLFRAAGNAAVKDMGLGLSLADVADRYPNLTAWSERVQALPGYDRTYPPHWR